MAPRKIQNRLTISILTVLATFFLIFSAAGQGEDDILAYYWQKAADMFAESNPASLAYKLSTRSYFKTLGRRGAIDKLDSASIDYYYSNGKLDSQVVHDGDQSRFSTVDLIIPDLFYNDYRLSTFPNDDGGDNLAIGLNTDSAKTEIPDGIAIVNRRTYQLQWLYLYYDTYQDFNRYTRSYRIVEHEGVIFPDSCWIVASRHGILFSEHYRLETAVTDIEVLKPRADY